MVKKSETATPTAGFIDTHFHSQEMLKKGMDLDSELRDAFEQGLTWGLDVATHIHDYASRISCFREIPQIGLTLGLYPSVVEEVDWTRHLLELDRLLGANNKSRFALAVGECGIDAHWNYGTIEDQMTLFDEQVRLANKHALPIVVHNRNADEQILEVFRRSPPRSGIMHCFSSSKDIARSFLDRGLHLSFAGNLTYKANEALREVLAWMPRERILFETDSPYLSPIPHRGKLNRPGQVSYVYEFAASILRISSQELMRQIQENVNSLFPSALEE